MVATLKTMESVRLAGEQLLHALSEADAAEPSPAVQLSIAEDTPGLSSISSLVREQWLVLLSLLPVLEGVARIRPLPIHISFCGAFIGDSVSWASGSPYPSCTIRPHARQILLSRHVAAHPGSGHGDVQHHCARPAVSSED